MGSNIFILRSPKIQHKTSAALDTKIMCFWDKVHTSERPERMCTDLKFTCITTNGK